MQMDGYVEAYAVWHRWSDLLFFIVFVIGES